MSSHAYRLRLWNRRKATAFVIVPVAEIEHGDGFTLMELFCFDGVELLERILPDGTRVPSLRLPKELTPIRPKIAADAGEKRCTETPGQLKSE